MRLVGYLISSISLFLSACGPLSTPPQADNQSGHPTAVSSPSDRLKQTIAQAIPELQNPHLDDWTKVNLLRRWAYRHIDVVSESCVKHHAMAPDVSYREAPVIFADFAADKAGVWCAGASDSLLRLYQHYGYTAYSLHFGDKKSLTHTFTLVRIQHEGQPLLVVQDAYLNNTYTDPQNNPLDYWEIIRRLARQQNQQVKVLQQLGDVRDVYYCGNTLAPVQYYNAPAHDLEPVTQLEPGRSKFTYGMTLPVFEQMHQLAPQTREFLVKQGYAPDFKYLLMFPYYASDGNNQQPQLVQQAQKLIQANAKSIAVGASGSRAHL